MIWYVTLLCLETTNQSPNKNKPEPQHSKPAVTAMFNCTQNCLHMRHSATKLLEQPPTSNNPIMGESTAKSSYHFLSYLWIEAKDAQNMNNHFVDIFHVRIISEQWLQLAGLQFTAGNPTCNGKHNVIQPYFTATINNHHLLPALNDQRHSKATYIYIPHITP